MKNLLLLTFLLFGLNVFSQDANPDYNKFIKETQISNTTDGVVQVIWWIPIEFWDIALHRNKDITEEQIENLTSVLEQYSIFAVVKGNIGDFGDINFLPFEVFENQVTAVGTDGKSHDPISFDELNVSTQSILSMLKPILKGAIGQMGENMHFFVFEDLGKKKKHRNFDPNAEGEVKLVVLENDFSWTTPLSSLLPPKSCPVDGEELSGSWNYCPIHGNELE